MERPTVFQYFGRMAKLAATRSTCSKRQVGCILTVDHQIVATGYNGGLPGEEHCTEVGCLLDKNSKCVRTIHAELNALLQCAKKGTSCQGARAFVTAVPCIACAKAMKQAGIVEVVCVIDKESFDKRFERVQSLGLVVWRLDDDYI